LKPENILIDKDGYAKLTDFGLSKDNFYSEQRAHSFCGTTEYLAPEILNKKGYTLTCDWWSFGCIIYEMLSAVPPFYSKKRDEIYDKIRFKSPNFYQYHSANAVDLISKLLTKDPAKRLGATRDAEEIKCHPFFADIDWAKMMQKTCKTPYKPLLDSKDDTKHFDRGICEIPIESPNTVNSGNHPQSSGSYMDEDDEFDGFSFVAQTVAASDLTINEANYE
jgi:serum/glucocorticoid-regulated kinase 2